MRVDNGSNRYVKPTKTYLPKKRLFMQEHETMNPSFDHNRIHIPGPKSTSIFINQPHCKVSVFYTVLNP